MMISKSADQPFPFLSCCLLLSLMLPSPSSSSTPSLLSSSVQLLAQARSVWHALPAGVFGRAVISWPGSNVLWCKVLRFYFPISRVPSFVPPLALLPVVFTVAAVVQAPSIGLPYALLFYTFVRYPPTAGHSGMLPQHGLSALSTLELWGTGSGRQRKGPATKPNRALSY